MLAITGGKGGCGKTTTALGIARVVGEGEPVTVVDADRDMPDLHVRTETPLTPGLDAIVDGAPVETCRHPAVGYPGVSIVPAGNDCSTVVPPLERLRSTGRRVIVDTPAGASVDVTAPIEVADRVLLVSTPTRESLVDTAKTAALARSVNTPIAGVVLNRSSGSVDPTGLLDCPLLGHVPTVSRSAPDAVERSSYASVVRKLRKRNT